MTDNHDNVFTEHHFTCMYSFHLHHGNVELSTIVQTHTNIKHVYSSLTAYPQIPAVLPLEGPHWPLWASLQSLLSWCPSQVRLQAASFPLTLGEPLPATKQCATTTQQTKHTRNVDRFTVQYRVRDNFRSGS